MRPRTPPTKLTTRAPSPPRSQAPAESRPVSADIDDGPVRISKLLAERGLCSRREADEYIAQGLVLLDGQPVTELGTRALRHQTVSLAPGASRRQAQRLTLILNKPIGHVSHADDEGRYPAAVQLIQPDRQWTDPRQPPSRSHGRGHIPLRGLAPAGRLDIDSTGMLVLTQDGRIARLLIGEDSTIEKEYLVRVSGTLDAAGLALLQHGLSLDGRALAPAKVSWQNQDQLRFVLREGRYRQIRRMCELVGLQVTGLKRIRIGRIPLGHLPLGQWRVLSEHERF
jgi:23S rRNA pseudouridine2604 synthase